MAHLIMCLYVALKYIGFLADMKEYTDKNIWSWKSHGNGD